ncbi:hypothetical protein NPIL_341821 [Nephila pilipes]|uniref:Uncharacterized protein n=1 Tax=Nephila pilipes TaxID=299642 RepID=A0A8X6NIH1_NEPPI|nr:hypothetical protein NPIL_341821 [Nephila pilipes]
MDVSSERNGGSERNWRISGNFGGWKWIAIRMDGDDDALKLFWFRVKEKKRGFECDLNWILGNDAFGYTRQNLNKGMHKLGGG